MRALRDIDPCAPSGRHRAAIVAAVLLSACLAWAPCAAAAAAATTGSVHPVLSPTEDTSSTFAPFYRTDPASQPGELAALADGSVLVGASRHGVQSPATQADITRIDQHGNEIAHYAVPAVPGEAQVNLFDITVHDGSIYTVDVSSERLLT